MPRFTPVEGNPFEDTGRNVTYRPVVGNPFAPDFTDETDEVKASDYLKSVASGIGPVVEGAGFAVRKLGAPGVIAEQGVLGARGLGTALEEAGRNVSGYWQKRLSPAAKREQARKVIKTDEEGNLVGLGDFGLHTIGLTAAQSAPSMASMIVPGMAATKALTAAKLGSRAAGAIGFGAAEGLTSGAMNAAQSGSMVRTTPEETLSKSPEYQKKLAAGMTPDQAREDIARKVENEVFRRTSIWTGLTGAVPGAVFGKIMSGASKFGRLGSAAEAGLTEFGQETVQSGGERFIENTAMKRGVDPSIEPMAGVYDEAAKGGLAGMVLGGGSGALIHEQAPPVADDVMDTSAVVTEEPPPKGRLARAAETAAALNEEEAAAAAQLADDAVGQEAPAPPAPFSVDIGSVRKKLARREARKLSEKTGLPYEVVPDPQREGLFIASPAVDDERAYELALDRPQAETLARRLMEKNGVSHAVIPHPTEEGKFAVAEEGPEPLTLEEASAQAEEMTQFGYLFDVIAHPAVEGAYTLKLIDQEPIRSPEELMGERPSAAEDMTEKQLMNISDRAFENPVAAQQFRDELVKEGGFKSGELKINSWIGRDDVARYSVFPTRETRKKAKPEPEPKPKQIGIEESLGPVATPHADEINGIPVDKAVEMITGGRFGDLLQDIIRAREAGADKTALEDGLINATVDAYQQARESGDLEAQAALQAAEPLIRKVIAGETLDERDLGSFPLSERRGDDVFRKRVAEMTPEERATALLTSDKTGLPNRRAWDEGEKKPTQVSIDIDGLGPINDTYGHDAGDKLLRETGRAFLEAGVDGYHFSGDEFALQAGSDQEADEAINNVRNILKGTIIEIETPDGRRARVEGPEFSFGKGEDYATADQRLLEDKKRRTETGERAPKGTLPPWVVQGAESQDRPDVPDEGVPERQQDSEDHQAGRDRDQSREVAPSPLPVHDDTLPDRPRGVAPAADTLAKQPWEMTRDEYVHVPTEKPKTFTISIQFPSPIGAQKIRFVPTRQKKSGVSAPRVKAIAIDGRGKESQASASDIGDVAGKPFFQNETEAIPYARLLLWIEGKISTEAAATKSKEGALQQAHYRSVAEALREGKPVPAEVLADYPELRPRPADTEIAEIKPAAEKKEEKKPPDAHPYSSTQFAASDTPAPTAEPGVFPTRKKARRALKELGRTGEVVGERGAYRIEYAEEQTPTLATAESTYGAGNKLVTRERAEEIRQKLRAKLNEQRGGIDPELMSLGAELAVFHVEAGARKFTEFTRAMIADLGEKARAYLPAWYMAARNWPGMDRSGMDTEAEIDRITQTKGEAEATEETGRGRGAEQRPADVREEGPEEVAFKEGDRVVFARDGRHGEVINVISMRFAPLGLSRAGVSAGEVSHITRSYTVRTDEGAERLAGEDDLSRETERPDTVIPDPRVNGTPTEPDRLRDRIAYAKKNAALARKRAGRARKKTNAESHIRNAITHDEEAAQLDNIWTEWAERYPDEAEKHKPVQKPPPESVRPPESGEGPLYIDELSEKAIIVRGDTRTHKERIKAAGGRWNRKHEGWIFPKSRRGQAEDRLSDLLFIDDTGAGWFINEDDRPIWADVKAAADAGWRGPFGAQEVSELTGTDETYLQKDGNPAYTPEFPAPKGKEIDKSPSKADIIDTEETTEETKDESGRRRETDIRTDREHEPDGAAGVAGQSPETLEEVAPEDGAAAREERDAGEGAGVRGRADAHALPPPDGQRDRPVHSEKRSDAQAPSVSGRGRRGDTGRGPDALRETERRGDTQENKESQVGAEESPGQVPRRGGEPGRGSVSAGDIRTGGETELLSPVHRAGTRPSGLNYRITADAEIGAGGPVQKFKDNIAAIRLLKQIEAEGRRATAEEQSVLVKYAGWGGLKDAFEYYYDEGNPWKARHEELEQLLTEEEYEAARGSTINAHYTSPEVIRGIHSAVERLGFKGGRVLEPALGIGHFFGLAPGGTLANSTLVGVELDPISGGIAKQLYQDATVHVSGYEETTFPDNFFDLVISNVPFANYKPYDPKHNKRRFSLHDYYFVKSLAHTRPGGIVAFITSSFTMDKVRWRARKAIADQADFLGAIRLPNNAFKKNAGTEVTTDIIFLRKKGAGRAMDAEPWIETVEAMSGTDKITINEYYKRHPEMMLGTMSLEGSMYRSGEQALVSDGRDLGQALGEAVEKLPEGVVGVEQHEATRPYVEAATIPAPGDIKENGFVFHGDNLMTKVGDKLVPELLPTGKDGKPTAASRRKVRVIKDILPIRDAARRVLKLQREDATDRAIEKAMKRLNQRYDTFVEKHGYLSAKENKTAFFNDPDSSLILALENWNADTKTAAKADIFTKKTIARVTPVESVESVKDGLMVSLNEGGRIDWKHIARISGVSAKQAQQELLEEGVVYENPEGGWETADAYLSGNVRAKLAAAKAAAAVDSKYKRNAAALEAVQPEDLPPHKIATRLGSPWTPPEYLSQFIGSLLNIEPDAVKVEYLEGVGRWVITSGTRYTPLNDFRRRTEALETWGTPDRDFFNLLDAALNLRKVAVTRKDSGGKESTDVKATDAAQEKLSKIKEEFERWIYADTGRAETIAQIYNTGYNNIKLREYDGAHLTLPGITSTVTLRPIQKNAVWRIVQSGNTYLGHEVGVGKTFEMISAAMEMKRLGLARKPMLVVLKATLDQFRAEFQRLYPGSNVLVVSIPGKAEPRKRQMARIASGDWDAVIVTHESFKKLPLTPETYNAFIREEIAKLQEVILARSEEMSRSAVKELEKRKKALISKIRTAIKEEQKDDAINFEDLGVDMLFVDEAHTHKNLSFATSLTRVRGLNPKGSDIAFDLFTKAAHINRLQGGKRGLVMASGTPISNSVAELFTISRYLQPKELEDRRLSNFDQWVGAFGNVERVAEYRPEGGGYKMVEKLSKFSNLPELMQMVYQALDAVTAEQAGVKRPKVKNGKIEAVLVPQNKMVADFQEELKTRSENIRQSPSQAQPDNMLVVVSDGRNAAMDMRLVDPSYPDDPDTKVNYLVKRAFAIWERTRDIKGTQLIFSDRGVPGKKGRFNVYDEIKKKLVERGVPANQIAFIHDAKNDNARDILFAKVRSGAVRFLIGSTQKAGTGVNVQERVAAVHHLDVNWTPMSYNQRNGRAIRQGNINPEVEIYSYVTEGTVDAFMWDKVKGKGQFIDSIMSGDVYLREAEDVSDETLSAAEMVAVASGDPLIAEKVGLEEQVRKLRNLEGAHRDKEWRLRRKLNDLPKEKAHVQSILKRNEGRMAEMSAVADKRVVIEQADVQSILKRNEGRIAEMSAVAGTRVVIGKTGYHPVNGAKDIEKRLKAIAETITIPVDHTVSDPRQIGRWGKLALYLQAEKQFGQKESRLLAKGEDGGLVEGYMAHANLHHLTGLKKAYDYKSQNARHAQRITDIDRDLKQVKEEASKPFDKQAELEEKSGRLREVTQRLNKEFENNATAPTEPEPGETGEDGSSDIRESRTGGQTETPEFKRWFGDSEVVDDEGKPLVVYHGTNAPDFTVFDISKLRIAEEPAFYFTDNPEGAKLYSGLVSKRARYYPAYLSIQNPLVEDFEGRTYSPARFAALIKQAKETGHDSVIFRNVVDDTVAAYRSMPPYNQYAVFSPEQIKSATGNRGTFDPESADILEAREEKGGGRASAKDLRRVNRVVERFRDAFRGLDIPIEVVATRDELPYRTTADVEAAFDKSGKIYIVADGLVAGAALRKVTIQKRAYQVLLHEAIGHYGIAEVMGDRFGDVVALASKMRAAGDAVIAREFERIADVYGFDLENEADLRRATEELIARLAETDPEHSFIRRVIAMIRKFLREIGVGIEFSRQELLELLAETKRQLRTPPRARAPAMPSRLGAEPAYSRQASEEPGKNIGEAPGGRAPWSQEQVYDHFNNAIAEKQRGSPETAMRQIQKSQISQLYGWAAEHVGDITHRMSQHPYHFKGYRDGVFEKAHKTLSALTDQYGFQREVEEQIQSNYEYDKSSGEPITSPHQMEIDLKELGRKYADEHKKIPVYNEAQFHAREAAVALGEWRFADAVKHLEALNDMVSNREEWSRQALDYTLDEDGNLIRYEDIRESLAGDQTETPEFKRWFGDSKVVDDEGKPLVVYHGTNANFSTFSDTDKGAHTGAPSARKGFFFAKDSYTAASYIWAKPSVFSGVIDAETKRIAAEEGKKEWQIGPDHPRRYARKLLRDLNNTKDRRSDVMKKLRGGLLGRAPAISKKEKTALKSELETIDQEIYTITSALEFWGRSLTWVNPDQYGATDIDAKLPNGQWMPRDRRDEPTPNIMPVYLHMGNPYIYDYEGRGYRDQSYTDVIDEAIEKGHDGVIFKNTTDGGPAPWTDIYVVFSPTQIKSATGNRGTFDPESADIRESRLTDLREVMEDMATAAKGDGKIRMGFFNQLLQTPEWWKHPVMKRVADIFIRRGDEFHKLFYRLDAGDEEKSVTQAIKELAHRGVGRLAFIKGKRSKEYQDLHDILVWADERAWNVEGSDPKERAQKIEAATVKEMERRGYAQETIETWRAVRRSFDRSLDELMKPLREFQREIEARAKKKGVAPVYPDIGDMKLIDVLKQMGQYRGLYAPRKRKGDWVIAGEDPEGQAFRTHETNRFKAVRLRRRLERQGYKLNDVREREQPSEDVYQALNIMATDQAIKEAVKRLKGDIDPELTKKFLEDVLVSTSDLIKSRGFRAAAIKRGEGDVVRGYIEDPMERYLTYTAGVAAGVAKSHAARQAFETFLGTVDEKGVRQGGVDAAKEPTVHDTGMKYIVEQLRNADSLDRVVGKAKAVASFKYLGFSARSALVNTTALVTTTPAAIHQYAMGGKGSLVAVSKALGRASKDYGLFMAGKAPNLTEDERLFIEQLKEEGWARPQFTREAMGHLQDAYGSGWMKMMDAAMYLFQKTEEFNRGTTILAAYRLARKNGADPAAAAGMARTATNRAHGIYGKSTLPMWALGTGPFRRGAQLYYVFGKFPHNYVQMLMDLGVEKKNIKAFAYALLSPIILGGATALPLKDAMVWVVGAILQALGEDRDPEKFVNDWVRETQGPEAEKAVRYGLAGLAGVNLSGSLSIGTGIPRNTYEALGAAGGVVHDFRYAVDAFRSGNSAAGWAYLAPSAFGNPIRAWSDRSGAMTRDNRPIWDEKGRQYVPSSGETALKALSFTGSNRATRNTRRWESKREERAFAKRRNRIYDLFRAYTMSGKKDQREFDEIMKMIEEYNKNAQESRLPISFITKKSIRRQMRAMSQPSRRELARIQ